MSTCIFINPDICQPAYFLNPFIYQPIYLSSRIFVKPPGCQPTFVPIHLGLNMIMGQPAYMSTRIFVNPHGCQSACVNLHGCQHVCFCVHLHICQSAWLSTRCCANLHGCKHVSTYMTVDLLCIDLNRGQPTCAWDCLCVNTQHALLLTCLCDNLLVSLSPCVNLIYQPESVSIYMGVRLLVLQHALLSTCLCINMPMSQSACALTFTGFSVPAWVGVILLTCY